MIEELIKDFAHQIFIMIKWVGIISAIGYIAIRVTNDFAKELEPKKDTEK